MPGLGPRIGVPPHITPFATESGGVTDTAPIMLIVPEPNKLDQTRLPMPIIASNIACRIFGRNNTNNPLAIQVKWDGKVMDEIIFYGEPLAGAPFAGIWTLFNQTVTDDARLEVFCGRDRAGVAAIRAGSMDGYPELISTDYENGLTITYPTAPGNLMLVVGGCLHKQAYPISSDKLTIQWSPEIESTTGHAPGAAAFFGNTFNPQDEDTYTLFPAETFPGIIVAAEWSLSQTRKGKKK